MNDQTNVERLADIWDEIFHAQEVAEERLNELRESNLKKLLDQQINQITAAETKRLESEQKISSQLLAFGFKADQIKEQQEKRYTAASLKAEQKKKEDAIKNDKRLSEAARNKKLADLQKEYAEKTKLADQFNKVEQKEEQKKFKDAKKRYAELREEGYSKEETQEILKAEGAEDPNKVAKAAGLQAAVDTAKKVFDGFAKQLQGDMKDIAYAQTEIDTRLYGYGSGINKVLSHWKRINTNITENIGMSPLVKQADVVTNLKTLVGKGIAYNVEQRAFLDTVSEKIATTFEATDATLLKLVRIQQADTTAARLGMEAALNEFLNSMYETTEYMTEAADSIRANIYEASALMGAQEATAFEFQVQKWMGSLFSAGFSNTSGLSGALGKLAAGDISAVTDGGYGNLLVMAANKADVSIADILAEGLDDSKTNQLMQAMVDYLGQIYDETKNSKVVAQQFANVYGLTASDLKAAANLAKSTGAISKKSMGYGNFTNKVHSMANTMALRTSTGEMMENVFGNLQYSTAATMANNPVLYATYQIASMLDDVAGGIAIPAFSIYGNMVDLETTVADLMRVTSVGAGLLGGIGKMMVGMGKKALTTGFGENPLLAAFGVHKGLSTLSYGSGTGFEKILSGTDTSNSGYVGNEDSGDVQKKTMQDARESGDEELSVQQDENNETKLSTVDEHIVQIYQLLSDVVDGIKPFKVKLEGYEPSFN